MSEPIAADFAGTNSHHVDAVLAGEKISRLEVLS